MEKMPSMPSMDPCQAMRRAKGRASLIVISFAIGVVLWSSNASLAEPTPSTLSGYLTIGSTAGNYEGDGEEGSWRGKSISGALHFRLPNGLNLQATGRIVDYSLGESISAPVWDTDNQDILSAAVFWRDPSIGLIGTYVETGGIKAWYDHHFNSIGVFGEIYPNDVSAIGANATFTDSNIEMNAYISSNDLTYEIWGEYFLNENAAIRLSAARQISRHDFISDWHENIIGVSGEYFIGNLSGMDGSLTAGYFHASYSDYNRVSNEQIRIGMRWYFGRPGNLHEARRKGAVEARYNSYVDVPRWWQFPL